ncbi:MAG: hypothetical protein KIS94_01435 [Chitinophagales bacterium]|nr:hypothetical protein [Chitinophagales bacterium]
MKCFLFFLSFFLLLCLSNANAQTEPQATTTRTHRDSVYLAKLNSSGNLMIAAGVGLCAAGGYLTYQGISVYRTIPNNIGTPSGDAQREQNKKQGTIYLVAAGVGIAGGVILTAFGVKNKVEFKRRKKRMEAEVGFLSGGQIGFALGF